MPTWTEQAKIYEAELREQPDNPNRVYNLAMATVMTVETGEAASIDTPAGKDIVASCEQALKRVVEATGGRHGNARALLGRIYMMTGRKDQAIQQLEPLLRELDPHDGGSWRNAAINLMALYMEKKSYGAAQAFGARWCELLPDDPEGAARLGLAWGVPGTEQNDRGACEKAVEALSRAVKMGHPQAGAHLQYVQNFVNAPKSPGDAVALGAKFQRDIAALMAGGDPPEEKARRVKLIQQSFQEEMRRLTGR